jgi:cell wall-associated NlpC family hydrolase
MIPLMISYLKSFLGTPYKLGGNVTQDGGIDCSALALEGLRSIGLWGKSDATAQTIFNTLLPKCTTPKIYSEGDLLFFGESKSKITHVSICVNDFQMIEAGGTDKDGMVRIRPISWRKDIVATLSIWHLKP